VTETTTDGGRRRLVIVESPAKARTIAGYLGPGFVVESSIGHIRDLPGRSAEIPADKKKEPWARLGVDVDNGFEPLYVVNPDKKQQVAKLKDALKNADELLLATDEDREGEAIAWHLLEVLKPRVPVRRMVFHEITPEAIREAVENPREINRNLVDAQETRRILDRLYGYEVSPVLWKKVMPRLSAGRVQSVATRLLVERERARMRFRSAGYWDLEAIFDTGEGDPRTFDATLVGVDGRRVATGRDFDESGQLSTDVTHLDADAAAALAARLSDASFSVRSVEPRPYRRSPYAPFITSTLQQEASRKLRFSAQVTMRLAQRLYENGYITYMRTDSTTLSDTALNAARDQARELYGADYVPPSPRRYERKVKNAQEAHEAIRPAGDRFRTPQHVRGELGADEFRLYELIWQRTVASQMADATGQSVSVRVVGNADGNGAPPVTAEFAASGKVITFPGFLRAYVEESDDEQAEREDRERRLPPLTEGQSLTATELEAKEHATNPPARYTEASLVKALEELGIGRPSTYASILGTIQDRGYVFKRGTALVPSFTAFAVIGLLEQHFSRLVDYGFTAGMEDDLDEIAAGQRERVQWLAAFYFGTGAGDDGAGEGLKELVHHRLGEIDAREVNSIPIGTAPAEDGGIDQPIVVRVGRYGPYVQQGADGETSNRASVPEDLPPDELTVEHALSLLAKQSDERLLGNDPVTSEPIVVRAGRYGPYVTTQPLETDGQPRTASLLKSMDMDSVSLEDALRLLSLPRVLGTDPGTGEEITVQNGRYGPYVKRGTESRSLEDEEQLFTLTHEQAVALLAQPKARGRRAAAAPLRELGADPVSGKPVVVKEGRFGPYVTDGESNASLRKGDSVEEITIERAAELLAERRAKGPATPRKRAAKKTTAKKTTKKTTKKTAAKKTAKKTTG
jgi:DNA topoisomerase-1